MIKDHCDPQVIIGEVASATDSNEAGMKAIARANKIAGLSEAYGYEDMVTLLGGEPA